MDKKTVKRGLLPYLFIALIMLGMFYFFGIANKDVTLGAKDDAIGLPINDDSWGFKKFSVKEYNKLLEKLGVEQLPVLAVVKNGDILAKTTKTDFKEFLKENDYIK